MSTFFSTRFTFLLAFKHELRIVALDRTHTSLEAYRCSYKTRLQTQVNIHRNRKRPQQKKVSIKIQFHRPFIKKVWLQYRNRGWLSHVPRRTALCARDTRSADCRPRPLLALYTYVQYMYILISVPPIFTSQELMYAWQIASKLNVNYALFLKI